MLNGYSGYACNFLKIVFTIVGSQLKPLIHVYHIIDRSYGCLLGDKPLKATVGLNPALGYTYKTAVLQITQHPFNKLLYYWVVTDLVFPLLTYFYKVGS